MPTLENLKKEAKRWLKALRANVAEARARLLRVFPNAPRIPTLRQIQHALAQERGFSGWAELKQRLPAEASLTRRYERVAEALVTAYRTGEPDAMQVIWEYFGHRRRWDAMRRYVRLDLGRREEPEGATRRNPSAPASSPSLAPARPRPARRPTRFRRANPPAPLACPGRDGRTAASPRSP